MLVIKNTSDAVYCNDVAIIMRIHSALSSILCGFKWIMNYCLCLVYSNQQDKCTMRSKASTIMNVVFRPYYFISKLITS